MSRSLPKTRDLSLGNRIKNPKNNPNDDEGNDDDENDDDKNNIDDRPIQKESDSFPLISESLFDFLLR